MFYLTTHSTHFIYPLLMESDYTYYRLLIGLQVCVDGLMKEGRECFI